MFELMFGTVWTAFSILIFVMIIMTGIEQGFLFPCFIMIIFIVIGVAILISGIKKIIRDRKTDQFGELCYALVTGVMYNGKSSNGVSYHDAYVKVYVESQDRFVEAHDDIGTDPEKYPVGSYVAVRFFEGDVNFEYSVPSFDGLPMHIRDKFDSGSIIPDDMDVWS